MGKPQVLHGISRLPEGGTLYLSLRQRGSQLQIRIVNPAPQPGTQLPLLAGAGHAQASISHRLAFQFGAGARMAASWAEGYYACEITLPLP